MKKVVLMYNPRSGNRTIISKMGKIIEVFNSRGILPVPYRLGEKSREDYAEIIRDTRPDAVVVAGGDGTVSSVLMTLQAEGLGDIPIGILPAGTCNDMSHNLGLKGPLERIAERFAALNVVKCDFAQVNGSRIFINTCAAGLLAEISNNTPGNFKKSAGKMAYFATTLAEVGRFTAFDLEIEYDVGRIEGEFFLMLLVNGRHAGGLSSVVPDASIDDGLLDLMLVRKCSTAELFPLMIRALGGALQTDRNVVCLRSERFVIRGSPDLVTTFDGDPGTSLPFEIVCRKRAASFIA